MTRFVYHNYVLIGAQKVKNTPKKYLITFWSVFVAEDSQIISYILVKQKQFTENQPFALIQDILEK